MREKGEGEKEIKERIRESDGGRQRM